jgi:hypothetical protein
MMLAEISGTKKTYLKVTIKELESKIKIKIIRDIYRAIKDFRKYYYTRNNIVKDDKGD